MASELERALISDGYDATTAQELLKMTDGKSASEAESFLKQLTSNEGAIRRYLSHRDGTPVKPGPAVPGQIVKPVRQKPAAGAPKSNTSSQTWSNNVQQAKGKTAPVRYEKPKTAAERLQAAVRPGNKPVSAPKPRTNNTRPYGLPLSSLAPSSSSSVPTPVVPVEIPAKSEKAVNRESATEIKIENLQDLDAALRDLELTRSRRGKCDCMGSIHGLTELAPNCLNCGRIICQKEGVGQCLSCGQHLLGESAINDIYLALIEQRQTLLSGMGKKALRKAGIDPDSVRSQSSLRSVPNKVFASSDSRAAPAAGANPLTLLSSEAVMPADIQDQLNIAEERRDRLLEFQATGAVRTRIIDQVEDFELPSEGTSLWASPQQQAAQLQAQQRTLRQEIAKRAVRAGQGRKIVSIDIRGNKVYQSFDDEASLAETLAEAERDASNDEEYIEITHDDYSQDSGKVESFFEYDKFAPKAAVRYPSKIKSTKAAAGTPHLATKPRFDPTKPDVIKRSEDELFAY